VAYNKAGIIKTGAPVISQTDNDAVRNVVKSVASENGAEFIDVNEAYNEYAYLIPAMQGEYQKKNAVTAALAVKAAGAAVSKEILVKGISKAVLPGRFEILNEDRCHGADNDQPMFIIDGAHNPDAMRALVTEYDKFAKNNEIRKTIFVFGCMKDKNSEEMVDIITSGLEGCEFLAVSIDYGRAEDPEVLAKRIKAKGRDCMACGSTSEAFEIAMKSGADCILAAGSIYLAGEMRSLFEKNVKHL
jgi:dihydrofolate synthase/folylpolyglutamate synthase